MNKSTILALLLLEQEIPCYESEQRVILPETYQVALSRTSKGGSKRCRELYCATGIENTSPSDKLRYLLKYVNGKATLGDLRSAIRNIKRNLYNELDDVGEF